MPRFSLLASTLPALVCAAALSLPTVATAATKLGVDQAKQVSFSLTGRSLTVTLRSDGTSNNPLLASLSGSEVLFSCRGVGPKGGKPRIATADATWETDASIVTVKLSRDVSKKVSWCVLELPDHSDIAVTTKMRTPKPQD
jgi:hypothetical protein